MNQKKPIVGLLRKFNSLLDFTEASCSLRYSINKLVFNNCLSIIETSFSYTLKISSSFIYDLAAISEHP